jgi:hypothetical protein
MLVLILGHPADWASPTRKVAGSFTRGIPGHSVRRLEEINSGKGAVMNLDEDAG